MEEPDDWGRSRGLTVETVGWCHECFTFQRYGRRRTTQMKKGLCANEDCDQTWAIGIWRMDEQPDWTQKRAVWGALADQEERSEP